MSEESAAVSPTQRAEKVRRLEGQLKWLERANVDEFVAYVNRLCCDPSPLVRTCSNYTDAIAEEKHLVAAGLGENHPRLKSLREKKRLEADKISAWIARARSQTASRLAELRKQSERQ